MMIRSRNAADGWVARLTGGTAAAFSTAQHRSFFRKDDLEVPSPASSWPWPAGERVTLLPISLSFVCFGFERMHDRA